MLNKLKSYICVTKRLRLENLKKKIFDGRTPRFRSDRSRSPRTPSKTDSPIVITDAQLFSVCYFNHTTNPTSKNSLGNRYLLTT